MQRSATSSRVRWMNRGAVVLIGALAIAFACSPGRDRERAATTSDAVVPDMPAPESQRCLGADGTRLRGTGRGWLVVRDHSARFDGHPVTPASLRALRDAEPSDRRGAHRFSQVGLFARPGLSMSIVAQWTSALRDLGGVELRAVIRTVHARETPSLGLVPITHYCGHEVRMADDGAPLSRFRNWGDLARTAEEAGGIHIAVPRTAP